MDPVPGRYKLAALLATLWCLILLPIQAYVFASPEMPNWLTPLDSPLRAVIDQAKQGIPGLDPYYIFGRCFFPAYLLLAYSFVGIRRSLTDDGRRVQRALGLALVGATAIGGVADAVTYWGGNDPDLSSLRAVQLGGWLVEEIALLVMVLATVGFAATALRGGTLRLAPGILVLTAGLLALPVGVLTYIPHGVVLTLSMAGLLMSYPGPRADRNDTSSA